MAGPAKEDNAVEHPGGTNTSNTAQQTSWQMNDEIYAVHSHVLMLKDFNNDNKHCSLLQMNAKKIRIFAYVYIMSFSFSREEIL